MGKARIRSGRPGGGELARTTVRLDGALLRETKAVAARTGRTLTKVIEDALRESLAREKRARRDARVTLPTSPLKGGLQPGVNLDDSAALRDLMEGAG
jgi:hypothetical protein